MAEKLPKGYWDIDDHSTDKANIAVILDHFQRYTTAPIQAIDVLRRAFAERDAALVNLQRRQAERVNTDLHSRDVPLIEYERVCRHCGSVETVIVYPTAKPMVCERPGCQEAEENRLLQLNAERQKRWRLKHEGEAPKRNGKGNPRPLRKASKVSPVPVEVAAAGHDPQIIRLVELMDGKELNAVMMLNDSGGENSIEKWFEAGAIEYTRRHGRPWVWKKLTYTTDIGTVEEPIEPGWCVDGVRIGAYASRALTSILNAVNTGVCKPSDKPRRR